MKLAFVTFHIDTAPRGSVGSVHPNTNLESVEYLNMIDLMFRSARVFHPGCRTIILSNVRTNLTSLHGKYEIWVTNSSPDSLMLDRARAMRDVADRLSTDTAIVFLDSDILLNRSLVSLLDVEFDVALTYREHPKHPINGGVIISRPAHPERVRWFFRKVADIYGERYAEASAWFGDQDAILDVLGRDRYASRASDDFEVGECRIRLLPCDTYNYSPEPSQTPIASPLGDRVLLHFKGPRKSLMPAFWDTHLSYRETGLRAWLGRTVARARAYLGQL